MLDLKVKKVVAADVQSQKDGTDTPKPTESEILGLFQDLSLASHPVALLKVYLEYCGEIVDADDEDFQDDPKLPRLLTDLYNSNSCNLSSSEFKKKATEIFASGLKIRPAQAEFVEQPTRKKAYCFEWLEQRSGRITASLFYAGTHSNPETPSESLIKKIVVMGIISKLKQLIGERKMKILLQKCIMQFNAKSIKILNQGIVDSL